MEVVVDVALAACFAGYLFLTTARQIQRILLGSFRTRALASRWALLLTAGRTLSLPSFTFFSHPPAFDLRVFGRIQQVDNAYSIWTPVSYRHPGWARALWNPDRKRQKVVLDAAAQLLRDVDIYLRSGSGHVQALPEYRLLADASAKACGAHAEVVQFLICEVSIAREQVSPRVIFISSLERLSASHCCTS